MTVINKTDKWYSVSSITGKFYFVNFKQSEKPFGITLCPFDNGFRVERKKLAKKIFEKYKQEGKSTIYFIWKSPQVQLLVDRDKCIKTVKKIVTKEMKPYLIINRNGNIIIGNPENIGLKAGDIFLGRKLRPVWRQLALCRIDIARKEFRKIPAHVRSVKYELFRNDLNIIKVRKVS